MKVKVIISIVTVVVLILGGLGWGVNYLFNYAIVRGDKDFISAEAASGGKSKGYESWEFAKEKPETLTQKTKDGLTLKATHFKQKQTGTAKLAIVAHGYTSDGMHMKDYAKMFYEMGYDVLVPDARAHGNSEGEYIGFGWPDRLDYLNWIKQMTDAYDNDVDIALYGISMGASTVMMVSGEKLPSNVKAIIEDCGYDTVENELKHQLGEMFGLPSFPLIPITSQYSKLRAGYNFKEASAVKQLEKNKLPMLFIHGDKDDFVPTKMVYPLYEATKGPKELVIVKGAAHAEAFTQDREKYQEMVSGFLSDYIK